MSATTLQRQGLLTEDGRTMAEEAWDSAQILGMVPIVAFVEIAATAGLLYWIMFH